MAMHSACVTYLAVIVAVVKLSRVPAVGDKPNDG